MDSTPSADSEPGAPGQESQVLSVLVALPAHSPLSATPLHYTHTGRLPPGTLVRVPLGARAVLGVVWDDVPLPQQEGLQLRPLLEAFTALPPLDASWRRLVTFTAHYYQRSMGEVALSALPPQLRDLNGTQLARRLRKLAADKGLEARTASAPLPLTPQQQQALDTLLAPADGGTAPRPCLLFGSTGSGKT